VFVSFSISARVHQVFVYMQERRKIAGSMMFERKRRGVSEYGNANADMHDLAPSAGAERMRSKWQGGGIRCRELFKICEL
jgi:hypothetical protein